MENVNKGDTLVQYYDNYNGQNIIGLVVVKSVSKTGQVTTTSGDTYDKQGYGRGKARGRIRPLKDGETVESIKAIFAERDAVKKAERDAEKAERDAQVKAQLEVVDAWMARPGNVMVVEMASVVGPIFIVNLSLPERPVVLMMAFNKEHSFGRDHYRCNISTQELRNNYLSGGSTSMTCEAIEPKAVAREWLRAWSWTEEMK